MAIVLALCFAEVWSQSPTMLQPTRRHDLHRPRPSSEPGRSMIQPIRKVVPIASAGDRSAVGLARSQDAELRRHRRGFRALHDSAVECLKSHTADFPPAVEGGVSRPGATLYSPAVKVAFEAPRRWWESDQQSLWRLTGRTRDITSPDLYPLAWLQRPRGRVLLVAYISRHLSGTQFSRP